LVGTSHHGLATAALAELPLRIKFPAPIVQPLKTAKRTIVILSLVLAGCNPNKAPAPTQEITTLKILADRSARPLLIDLANAYRPSGMIVSWDLQVGEAGSVIDWLKSGAAPYALLDYTPEMFEAVVPSLWITPAARDGIAIIVNTANPITNLTASQLRSILQGRVDDWQAFGLPPLPLTVVTRPESSSETALVQHTVLGERRLTKAARLAVTATTMIEIVSSIPGAIGYASLGHLTGAIKTVTLEGIPLTLDTINNGQYPLSMPMVFAGKSEPPDGPYRDFFAWVQSPEGQTIVRKHYGGVTTP
jgi:phosphate transport system substrate-binding protein